MKKLLSLLLTAALLIGALTVCAVDTSAAEKKTLTITNHRVPIAEVEVGNEFIVHVGLNSGGYSVNTLEAQLRYESDYVKVVEYGPIVRGKVYMDGYSFPESIRNTNLLSNFLNRDNLILYNFSKYNTGVGVFNDVSEHFFRVRFKAVAAGTTEILHYFKVLNSLEDNTVIRLIKDNISNDQLDPIPYSATTVEPAIGYIGDADGDYDLTVMDATFLQHVTAGENSSYNTINADVNADGAVDLKDALNILRYKAGLSADGNLGEWVFESER